MAKLVYEAKLGALDKVFTVTNNAIEDIIKDTDNLKEKTSLLLARDLAQTINQKYVENLNNISSYEHGSSTVKTSITDTKKGYIVHVSGKDVLYQEYGTGTRGAKKPHPRQKADGMKPYGSGRNIIHNGEKQNGKDTPYWYLLYRDFPGYLPNDFNGENIRPSDYVWRHDGTITKGLPAGRFVYDSCRQYQKSSGLDEKNVLKKTITQAIKKDFINKMNTTIKKTRNTVTKPGVKLKINRDMAEYRLLEEMRRGAGL